MTTKQPAAATQGSNLARHQKWGLIIFVISNIFCADEMVPGWGLFHLDWPIYYFYVISVIGGTIGGAIFGGKYLIPGLIGGAIAGPGALFAVGKYLASVNVSYSTIDCLMAILGALPGIGIGLLLAWIQKVLSRAATQPGTQTRA